MVVSSSSLSCLCLWNVLKQNQFCKKSSAQKFSNMEGSRYSCIKFFCVLSLYSSKTSFTNNRSFLLFSLLDIESIGWVNLLLDIRPMSRLVFRSSGDLLHSLQLLFKISSITNFPLQYKVHCGALSAGRPGVFALDLFISWPNESKSDRTRGNHMIVQLLCVYLLCLCARRLWSFVSTLANTCFLQNSHTCR